jgi:hypothetical protein
MAREALSGLSGEIGPFLKREGAFFMEGVDADPRTLTRYTGVTSFDTSGYAAEKVVGQMGLLGAVFAPEKDESAVPWRRLSVGHNPAKPWSLDLKHAIGGENRVGYLRTYVFSPVKQRARLDIGSDAVKVVVGRVVPGGPDEGVTYIMDPVNLFAPKNAGPQFNNYLPWPPFRTPGGFPGFGYDSKHSLLVEYRMDSSTYPLPASNGFTFHPGIISSMLPRFRVFARGGGGMGTVEAASFPENYPNAWGPLPSPGGYGDNCRYFMVFDFVKRTSTIDSFCLGGIPPGGTSMDFLSPLFTSSPI